MTNPNRRRFLGRVSLAAASLATGGCASSRPDPDAAVLTQGRLPFRVRLESPTDPGIRRAFTLLRNRLEARNAIQVSETTSRDAALTLALDPRLPAEGFRVTDGARGPELAGGSAQGLVHGLGKYLRTCRHGEAFVPSPWRGLSQPKGRLRGMYFAAHFHNWYHQASEPEIERYLEDLALWGVNTLWTSFPAMNLQGWDDPATESALSMIRSHGRAARRLGLKYGTSVGNTWFSGTPAAVRAQPLPDPTGRRGNHGFPICPSDPEGHTLILAHARRLYESLKDTGLDVLVFWPYDEGGCSCPQCHPWGSRGYLKLSRELAQLGRSIFPNLETVLSTWMFDTPPEGEWEGLSTALDRGEPWLDHILADAHEDFPRYPLDQGVPGRRPLLNFPEISMWGNWPWGGFGANPLPARFQRLWDQVKHRVEGGFPYSEGIYEDMNKAVVSQFYWNPENTARDTLREYIAYEFGPGVEEEVLTLVDLAEATASASYRKQPVDQAHVQRAAELAESVDRRLPEWGRTNWRWEILRLRTVLDRERFGGGGLESPAAEAAMLRLIEIYHCELDTRDPYHHRVRPPLKRAISRAGNH